MEAPAPVNVKMEEMPVMLSAPVKAEPVTDVHLNLGGFSNLNGNEFMSQAFAGMQQPFQPSLSPSMFMHNPMPMPNSMPPHNSMSMRNSIPMPNFAMGMGLPNSAIFPATNEFVPQYNYGNGMPMPQFMPRPQPLSANPYAHLLFNPNPLANQFSNHQGFF
ncbi:hypothetical protein NLJ89_g3347 [Agrocybe chaxingu]|uniref:Uncharacterized protein n=1 Tax=Agrocybe chaxingu TaxID=84603 RepID=A0A9W8K5S7_9AGAR|nr:hypothetical protein NLJ89_g3347 [Agrocybe chaxingu]